MKRLTANAMVHNQESRKRIHNNTNSDDMAWDWDGFYCIQSNQSFDGSSLSIHGFTKRRHGRRICGLKFSGLPAESFPESWEGCLVRWYDIVLAESLLATINRREE